MNHEQLPTELVYPIEINNTQFLDSQPTIPNIQHTDKTVFTTHIDAGRYDEEDTSNNNPDSGGHDSNKENGQPTADTNGTIPGNISKSQESTQFDASGHSSNSGGWTEISNPIE
ncbi:hypothetical protein AX14_005825 [Amanita brunnescens Koide BX004]|nr:hypothetical protein AX14_005825 [Amanita brunnescens Koide BX004]